MTDLPFQLKKIGSGDITIGDTTRTISVSGGTITVPFTQNNATRVINVPMYQSLCRDDFNGSGYAVVNSNLWSNGVYVLYSNKQDFTELIGDFGSHSGLGPSPIPSVAEWGCYGNKFRLHLKSRSGWADYCSISIAFSAGTLTPGKAFIIDSYFYMDTNDSRIYLSTSSGYPRTYIQMEGMGAGILVDEGMVGPPALSWNTSCGPSPNYQFKDAGFYQGRATIWNKEYNDARVYYRQSELLPRVEIDYELCQFHGSSTVIVPSLSLAAYSGYDESSDVICEVDYYELISEDNPCVGVVDALPW